MRRLWSYLFFAAALALTVACGKSVISSQGEPPELLMAVPADALTVGVFGRCDHALEQMLDSANVLRCLDYGKLAKHKAVLALCDVGSISPLLIIETGKADPGEGLRAATDTLPQTAELAALADSLRIASAQLALSRHNALLLSPSATVITVVRRHLGNETSILDAPNFDGVLAAMGSSDAIAWRNSGAGKLFPLSLCSITGKQLSSFLKGATEWTVASGGRLHTVQTPAERYYCNFLNAVSEGESKLGSAFPAEARLVIDMPIADLNQWRQAYETLMDARVELEAYGKRIQNLKKATGKSPLDWEKELGIKEVVYVATDQYSLNMVRCAKGGKREGVKANSAGGFVRALYGEPFSASDSCVVRHGKWLVSGPRAVLDTLTLVSVKNWPSKAAATVQAEGRRLTWTKENNILWQDSNQ